ncbi:MAG: hypothetical protein J5802_13400 [Butyrivibrio sp.]|nr:hypothetical protein [Butyrivibrio sp.]
MLERFGLTKQEIVVYNQMSVVNGKTGYMIAKDINMSRSNVYPLLSSLVKKGAIIYEDGESRKYYRVKPEEFFNNYIAGLEKIKDELIEELKEDDKPHDGYFTIAGETNIRNKMVSLVDNVAERVYVCGKKEEIFFLNTNFKTLCEQGKKVVVITDDIKGWNDRILLYKSNHEILQVGLIADSTSAMVGNIKGAGTSCLFSANKNFVISYKMNLKNEIEITEMKRKRS